MPKSRSKKKPKAKPKASPNAKKRVTVAKERQYKLSAEAINAITDLDEKLDDKNMGQIVSEAVVQYALANGVAVEGHKKQATADNLARKVKKLEGTVKALSEIALLEACNIAAIKKAERLVQQEVDDGTKRNADALWEELEGRLPPCMGDDVDVFRVFLAVHGIPKKSKQ